MLKKRSAKDISYAGTTIYAVGLVLMVAYLLLVPAFAAAIPTAFELLFVLVIIAGKQLT
jgi:hypothetical protein